VLLDLSAFLIHMVLRQYLAFLALRQHLEFGLQRTVISEDNLLDIRVSEENSAEIELFHRLDFDQGDLAFSFDWQGKHVLSDSVDIDDHDHVVFSRH
jgi:hypothetical protein